MSNSGESVLPTQVSIINMACLRRSPEDRSLVVKKIGKACQQLGLFHIVNHGISELVIEEVLHGALGFFELPTEEKEKFMSTNIQNPVTYQVNSRELLKHYSHPLEDYVEFWPDNPSYYREKMGSYANKVQKLGMEVLGAIMESLGLPSTYLNDKIDKGLQIMAVNYYSPTTFTDASPSLRPHTDHSIITILLQSSPGLQMLKREVGKWNSVPKLHGAVEILVGDLLKVLSNGLYKSVTHRVNENSSKTRISIASFHNPALDEIIEPAKEIVNGKLPRKYKGSSVRDFMRFVSTNKDSQMFIKSLEI